MKTRQTKALLGVILGFTSILNAGQTTLLFDESIASEKPAHVYISMNWDPNLSIPEPSWNGYKRFPMFDDGNHGDGKANDGVWGYQSDIPPSPMDRFQWAIDLDDNADNGWLGTGPDFRVLDDTGVSVEFFKKPIEATLTTNELEELLKLSLKTPQQPIPINDGSEFLFSISAPGATNVFLAGSFNQWAGNDDGVITDKRFQMYPHGNGLWVRILELPPGVIRYKYAIQSPENAYRWVGDPNVDNADSDGNTVLDLRTLMPDRFITSIPGRELRPTAMPAFESQTKNASILDLNLEKVWITPTETHNLGVQIESLFESDDLVLSGSFSRDLSTWSPLGITPIDQITTLTLAGEGIERPIFLEIELRDSRQVYDREIMVLPVVEEISNDLRYGFYANWNHISSDYGKKSDMLADLLINAVEYYDYFPAHGDYAPTEDVYEFEPFFGNKIYARDIEGKINSGHDRNLLAIAYVAAYAASRSVFEAHPYPMTTASGEPRVFNGRVTTEAEADAKGEEKWFWLMAIARDTPWYPIIMDEFRRTMEDNSDDLVAFDGFEIDSYGHGESDQYFSADSASNGRLLADVIAELIADVHEMAHEIKPAAAVSFNCVCEFGVDRMYEITDFIFIENWAGCKAGIDETVEICYVHRAPTHQRVILKIYPPDAGFTDPPYFPEDSLRLMMGMCITGGGSLMVAGEPNEATNEMHALNSLYYPDNVPIPEANRKIIRDYNHFDAALYGYNHGREVSNRESKLYIPGVITRAFENSAGDQTFIFLNTGDQTTWNTPRPEVNAITEKEIALDISSQTVIKEVLYLTPDTGGLTKPVSLDFERKGDFIRTIIPSLHTTGAIVLIAEK